VLRVVTLGTLAVSHAERELGRAVVQPRRLALLAVLARAGERGVGRDALLALFWPDADDRARRSLAQALYALRRDLGDDAAIIGTHELRLDPARVAVDVAEYAAHVKRGRLDEAASLYGGPFLAGFSVANAPEFDRWVDEERSVLARDHARVLERLALAAERDGDLAGAAARWRALAAAEPLDARVAVRLMTALDAAGDRAGALTHARVYEALVGQELDLPPDREVVALAERLRRAGEVVAPRLTAPDAPGVDAASTTPASNAPAPNPTAPNVTPRVAPVPDMAMPPAAAPRAAGPPRLIPAARVTRPRILRRRALAGALAVLAIGAAAVRRGRAAPKPALVAEGAAAGSTLGAGVAAGPVIAVGLIADFRGERGGAARPLSDMLATNLARAEGVRVVSPARVHELLRQLGASDTAVEGFIAAARQAGAGELVDGTLYARPGGALRLDLRRVDVATGAVRAALTLEGEDLFALADSGTARVLAGSGAPGSRGRWPT
jgi:DNA-binding SARP family transcriptional activator